MTDSEREDITRVLVVEDSPTQSRRFALMLRSSGFHVDTADTVAGGLACIAEGIVDVVLLDLTLPDSEGLQTFCTVHARAPETPIVVLTSLDDESAALEAMKQGAQDYLVKSRVDSASMTRSLRYSIERNTRAQIEQDLRAKEEEIRLARLKETFIQVASHELRTPLTAVLGLAELAAGAPNVEEPLAGWLKRLKDAGVRLRQLVDQMVKMLIEGYQQQRLERRTTAVEELLRGAAEDVEPFVEIRRQSLESKLPDDLGSLDVDGSKIRDCVGNLLLNAIKFTPDEGKILLAASRGEEVLEITVTDTGDGIDAVSLPHVFDPFFAGFDVMRHSAGSFEYQSRGMGLGLTIVKLFVEMHGGDVEAQSEPGVGSRFTIRLPLEPVDDAA